MLEANTDIIKGEYVLLIHGCELDESSKDVDAAMSLLEDICAHIPYKVAVDIVANFTGIRRNQVYSMGVKKKTKN